MTTTTPTTGASLPTPTRSPTASERFVLTLWTADPRLAVAADHAGVDRIGVDLERLGKRERQAGLGTWISPHTVADLHRVGAVLRRAQAFARVNPLHHGSAGEVERLLAAGAQVLMLPMFATVGEVQEFCDLVAGRAEVVLLLERAQAIESLEEIVAVPGVAEVHIGVNDLALSLGLRNRFEVLVSPELDRVSAVVCEAGLRFGVGGIGRWNDTALPVPSDLVYAQHARLGSEAALLARVFLRSHGPYEALSRDVDAARRRIGAWRMSGDGPLEDARDALAGSLGLAATW